MNEYFKTCTILFFTGIKTGIHPALIFNESTQLAIQELISQYNLNVEILQADGIQVANDWPNSNLYSTEIEKYLCTAYSKKFNEGFRKVIGVFSLPSLLTSKHIEEAMLSIRPLDFCVGPDSHGGIYLLGMNTYEEKLILHQPWLGSTLSKSIIREIGNQKKITYKLPTLGI
jgi:glycosyltransferase A (GT-A) superfamily protein (DUF2064 family)